MPMDAMDKLKTMLDERASADPLFAKSYANSDKSYHKCWQYILSKARKLAAGGTACAVTDEEVLGWAVHYYDEDDANLDIPQDIERKVKTLCTADQPGQKPQPQTSTQAAKPTAKATPKKQTQKKETADLFYGSLFD